MESRVWRAYVGLLATTILSVEAATFSNRSTPVSFYSSTYGPSIAAYSFTWSQYIKPTIIGTVEIIINTDTNRTLTTTKTKTEFMNNGTLSVLTRTDTNDAGTVTAVKTDIFGNNFTAAYPTPALQLSSRMTWDAMLPVSTNNTVCCFWETTYSPTPAHTPFASPTPGPVDSADPSGWLYTLRGIDYGDPYFEMDAGNITSLWGGQSIGISYTGCPHTICNITTTTVAAAVAVSAQAFLFATSTITTSGLDPSAAAKASPAGSSPPSVVVDPITAGPSPTPPSSPDVGNAPIVSSSATSSSSTTRVTSAASGVDTAPAILPQSDPPTPPSRTQSSKTISAIPATAHLESSQSALVIPVSSQTKPADIGGAIISIIQSGGTASGGGVAIQPQNNNLPPTTTNALSVLVEAQSSIAAANNNGGQNPGSQVQPASSAAPPQPIVVGSVTLTADSSSNLVVSGQTLAPGSTITLGSGSSTTIIALSTGSSQTVLQIGTSFSTLPPNSPVPPAPTALPPLTIGSLVVTPNSASAYVIGSQTLQPGGPGITISNTVISLASAATALVVDGTTSQILTTAEGGVGGYVWSGLGGSARTSTSEVLSGSASGVITWSQGSDSGSATASAARTATTSAASSSKFGLRWVDMAALMALVAYLVLW